MRGWKEGVAVARPGRRLLTRPVAQLNSTQLDSVLRLYIHIHTYIEREKEKD